MKIIFLTFAFLAFTNAHFLRSLQEPNTDVDIDAVFSTPCTNFVGLKVTFDLGNGAAAAQNAGTITLEGDDADPDASQPKEASEMTIQCTKLTQGDKELVCDGTTSTIPSGLANGVIFKFTETTIEGYKAKAAQTNSVTYNSGYLALGTNEDQEVNYDDEDKKTFTVTYKAAIPATVTTLPEIKVGSEVVSCTTDEERKVLTCTPDKSKLEKKEDAYQITAKNVCGSYDNVAKLTITDSSAFLKASLALLVAVFLF